MSKVCVLGHPSEIKNKIMSVWASFYHWSILRYFRMYIYPQFLYIHPLFLYIYLSFMYKNKILCTKSTDLCTFQKNVQSSIYFVHEFNPFVQNPQHFVQELNPNVQESEVNVHDY